MYHIMPYNESVTMLYINSQEGLSKGKVYPCTGTEALYRPYGP